MQRAPAQVTGMSLFATLPMAGSLCNRLPSDAHTWRTGYADNHGSVYE
jgi:hypothetical protein